MKKLILILIMLIVLGGVGLGVYSFYEQQTAPPVSAGIKYYNSLDGSVISMDTVVYNEGSELELEPAAAPNGYSFSGWYDNANFYGQPIEKISTTQTGAVTLFAKFDVNTYSVIYKIGGVAVELDADSYVFGQGVVLSQPDSRPGYTFSGWKTNEDMTGEVVHSIGITEYGAKEFFGIWTANNYLINYVIDGESVVLDTDGYVFGNGVVLSQPDARPGYSFTGWKLNEDLTGDVVNTVGSSELGNKTFYGAFLANTYAVSYLIDGDIVELDNDSYVYGGGLALSVPAARAGYTFSGWRTNEDMTGDVVFVIEETDIGDKTFYGTFLANTYAVSYVVDGEVAEFNDDAYTYGVEFELPVPSVIDGYVFSGWKTNEDLTGESILVIEATDIGDKTFYGAQLCLFENITINYEDINPDTMVGAEATMSSYSAFDQLSPSLEITYLLDGVENTTVLSLFEYEYFEDDSLMRCYTNVDFEQDDIDMSAINILLNCGLNALALEDEDNFPQSALDNFVVQIYTTSVFETFVITNIVAEPVETYSVKFIIDGEEVENNLDSYSYGDMIELTLPEAPLGYEFSGWYLDAERSRSVSNIDLTISGNLVLHGFFDDTSIATLNAFTQGQNSVVYGQTSSWWPGSAAQYDITVQQVSNGEVRVFTVNLVREIVEQDNTFYFTADGSSTLELLDGNYTLSVLYGYSFNLTEDNYLDTISIHNNPAYHGDFRNSNTMFAIQSTNDISNDSFRILSIDTVAYLDSDITNLTEHSYLINQGGSPNTGIGSEFEYTALLRNDFIVPGSVHNGYRYYIEINNQAFTFDIPVNNSVVNSYDVEFVVDLGDGVQRLCSFEQSYNEFTVVQRININEYNPEVGSESQAGLTGEVTFTIRAIEKL